VDPVDKEKIALRYRERIRDRGHSPAALGEPKGRQAFYFDFLLKFDGLEPSDSIVDIGCGYGDLFGYLRSRGWRGEYLGIDIIPELIEEGRRRYPDATLRVQDIQDEAIGGPFDWCMCCHALTSDTQNVPFLRHTEDMLRIMWAGCRKGLIFNMLSPLADYTNAIHARPRFGEVLDIVSGLTQRFVVRHDYMPFEYAIYAYKDDAIDRSLLIFEEHRATFDRVTTAWQPAQRREPEGS
jgi:SAM-dependent methyltransferase